MKQETQVYEAALSAQATDKCSEIVREYITSLKLSGKEATRYAMTIEEIILDSMESGECERLRLTTGKRLFRHGITLEVFGKPKNAYKENSTGSILGDSLLKNLGLSPEYSYSDNANTYTFRVKKKSAGSIVKLAVAIISAVILGLIGKSVLPAQFIGSVLDGFITPLHDTFLNMLSCVAGPMIFLSVTWGIYGIGDAATLKKIGKRLLTGYIGTVYAVTVVFTLICLPLFHPVISQGTTGSGDLASILNMILGIIPKNIFSPFTEGNTLQIIFLSAIVGVSMLVLEKKTTAIARAIEQINYIIQHLISFIGKLLPFFIFIVILSLIWSDSASSVATVGKLFIVCALCAFLMTVAIFLITALQMKTSPLKLAKIGFPTFIIALTTASSAAAFSTNVNICRNGYGISSTITSFGIPLGMVALKPATAIGYLASTLFFASFYNIEISVTWIITLIFFTGILAVATPPIPGGAITAYTVLFTQLGIPAEAIALAIAFDALFDFFTTGCDEFIMPLIILPHAKKLGMLEKKHW